MCAEAERAMCFVILAHAAEHGDPGLAVMYRKWLGSTKPAPLNVSGSNVITPDSAVVRLSAVSHVLLYTLSWSLSICHWLTIMSDWQSEFMSVTVLWKRTCSYSLKVPEHITLCKLQPQSSYKCWCRFSHSSPLTSFCYCLFTPTLNGKTVSVNSGW